MFDLERTITKWRQQMLSAGLKTPVPMEELESHLREEIELQMKSGLDAQASFQAAIQKIGAANMLKGEFEKVGKEARAQKQAQMMIMFSMMGVAGFAVFIATLLVFKVGNFSELTPQQQISGLAAVAVMLLLGFGGRLGYRFFPSIARKKIRNALCVSGGMALGLWWTIFFWGILPRHEYTIDQLCLAITWCFAMPFGAFLGLCAGIERAARKFAGN